MTNTDPPKLSPSILIKLVRFQGVRLHGERWSCRRRRGLWPGPKVITIKVEHGALCYYQRGRRRTLLQSTLANDYEPLNSATYTRLARALNLLP